MRLVILTAVVIILTAMRGHSVGAAPKRRNARIFSAEQRKSFEEIRSLLNAHSYGAAQRLASESVTLAKQRADKYGAAFFLYYASQAAGLSGSWGESAVLAAECRRLARETGESTLVSASSYALASAYLVSDQLDLAWGEAQTMLDHSDGTLQQSNLLALASAISARQGESAKALQYSRQALSDAAATGTLEQLAIANNQLGRRLLDAGELDGAERAFVEAYRLRLASKSKMLGQTYHNLGRLYLARREYGKAQVMFRRAIEWPHIEPNILPWSYFRLAQAVRELQGAEAAIPLLRTSLDLIASMRLEYPFANDLQVTSEAMLQDIADFFLDSAFEANRAHANPELVSEAFSIVQDHRASSLALRAGTSDSWRRKLPEDYFAKLAKLRSLEAEAIRTRQTPRAELLRLRADLTEVETRAGIGAAAQHHLSAAERRERLLHALGDGELLVSFHLGNPRSYAFLLHQGKLAVRELAAKTDLAPRVDAFRKALETGRGEARDLGDSLYRDLFSQLPPGKMLTIVPDDALYGLPFAALVSNGGWLGERYAIRLSPSAYFFGGRQQHPRPLRFTGVADPVFNKADPRWNGGMLARLGAILELDSGRQLARLVESEAEVREAAQFWHGSRILTGREISLDRISSSLDQSPGVLHVAAHMLRRTEAVSPSIALGLDTDGRLQVWTESDIAAMSNAPEFVTLSGCGSGRGPALRGAGLLGLTRSWLMAGSRAVAASYWPVPEQSHLLFHTYYRTLRDSEEEAMSSRRAAVALQRAQIEAIAKGGWQADPRYWAAYFVIGAL